MAGTSGSAQPRAYVVTVYGLYARDVGGWLPIAGLVRLLAELDIDELAVRSAVSRLKRRGFLVSSRRRSAAGYALSDAAREMLRDDDERIAVAPPATLDDGWLLVVFSVPESERVKRHLLRSRLAAMGFGAAGSGVLVAPAHRYASTRALLHRLHLESYVDLYRADYLGFGDLTTLSRQWWDLETRQESYMDFRRTWLPVLELWDAGAGVGVGALPDAGAGVGALPDAEAFVDWVRVHTAWRRLPNHDLGLPVELLPADWSGTAAVELYRALEERLAGAARVHATAVLRQTP